ncbi:MAG: peptidoglycan-binding domain-containing protein [Myxococcota bacterium]
MGDESYWEPIPYSNPRFDADPVLSEVAAGAGQLQQGDSGMAVRLIQQGLIDAGYALPEQGVSGQFGAETATAVRQLQSDRDLAPSGIVDAATLEALSFIHEEHRTVGAIAAGHEGGPLPEPRTLAAEEVAAFGEAIVTAPRTESGEEPDFVEVVDGVDYETAVRDRLSGMIAMLHREYQGVVEARQRPEGLHDWDHIEAVAGAAKDSTDAIFGGLAEGPPLVHGVNLFDAFEEESDMIANDPDYADYIADDLIRYLISTELNRIHARYGAVDTRPAESAILERVIADYLVTYRRELLEIQTAWPGQVIDDRILLQRDRARSDGGNRRQLWDMFSMMIHEYIHTLEHPDHQDYRASALTEQGGSLTLREGMCDYFTMLAFKNTEFTDELRQRVEGPYFNPERPSRIEEPWYYESVVEAERAVGVVGLRNAMAAFFQGRIDLIGGPA